ncbi:MFS transporter [Moraxella nasovis]|uniref:MFS transporter n=1 Tax=Moraxella nasovis TaxID=2904121 RepID=UPI001F61A5FA|nr:MFS transporter [Moraxella nasovis]UNU74222.1 MFS transporter [Moraxella nasovis]
MIHKPAIPLTLFFAGLIFTAANMRSPIVMLGSVSPMLSADFGMNAAAIGYLGALPMPLFAIGSLIAPYLAKRFGIEMMMICMTLLLAVGVATRSWSGIGLLFIGTLILSLAIGILNALSAPFIKKHIGSHIALATGVFSLSLSVIAGLGAWAVVPMSHALTWQLSLSLWAVFSVIAAVIWLITHQKSKIKHSATPAMAHQHFKQFNPWKAAQAWQMAVFLGLQSLMFYWAASFLTSVGIGYGLSLEQATGLMLAFQLVAPFAILLLTYLIKRDFPTQIFALLCAILNATGVAGLLWLPDYLYLWSGMMGFGGAATFTLVLMMFSLRTSSFETARDLSGMAQAVGYLIATLGPLLLGLLFEKMGDWHLPLMVLLGLMIVNIPMGFLAARSQKIDSAQS